MSQAEVDVPPVVFFWIAMFPMSLGVVGVFAGIYYRLQLGMFSTGMMVGSLPTKYLLQIVVYAVLLTTFVAVATPGVVNRLHRWSSPPT